MRHLRWLAILALTCGHVDAAAPERVEIAPLDQALTFARIAEAAGPRVVAVRTYAGDAVMAVDLAELLGRPVADPLSLFNELGYAALQQRIEAAGAPRRIALTELIQPLELGSHHIAAGTNYPAHADEAGVEEGPFLFPKLVAPTAPNAPVSAADRLLDYEVELCWVGLAPLRRDERAPHWGLMLCNDYTDRARLLRHLNPDNVASGIGFTTGKSFAGALPVGDLFVIPRDPRAFAAGIDLRLYRNGELKQQSRVSRAIWDIDEILRQAWLRSAMSWDYEGRQVRLFAEDGVLSARTLILSGTPDGTIFRGITLTQKLRGTGRWLVGGWERSLPENVIETCIADARASGEYLRAGETVVIRSDYLGSIVNRIQQ